MLIAFEGIDGSGKATQAKLLQEKLSQIFQDDPGAAPRYRDCVLHSFPQYDRTVSGLLIKRYLTGEFGSLDETHPLLTATLYAIDRHEMKQLLSHQLTNCKMLVVCDRYVPSNVAHQGAKAGKWGTDWKSLNEDILRIEHDVFDMPYPDLVFLLDLPECQSYARTHGRDDVADIHQADVMYLRKVREIYLELASSSDQWHVIECVNAVGTARTVESIRREILEVVKEKCSLTTQSPRPV